MDSYIINDVKCSHTDLSSKVLGSPCGSCVNTSGVFQVKRTIDINYCISTFGGLCYDRTFATYCNTGDCF